MRSAAAPRAVAWLLLPIARPPGPLSRRAPAGLGVAIGEAAPRGLWAGGLVVRRLAAAGLSGSWWGSCRGVALQVARCGAPGNREAWPEVTLEFFGAGSAPRRAPGKACFQARSQTASEPPTGEFEPPMAPGVPLAMRWKPGCILQGRNRRFMRLCRVLQWVGGDNNRGETGDPLAAWPEREPCRPSEGKPQ